jgi:bacterial DNA-binding protein
MNQKIPIRIFADKLSAETGISVEDAQKFIKTYFDEVAYNLHGGEPVKIQGLGSFFLTQSSADPIEFTPAQELAAEINAPFDMFEPIELPSDFDENNFAETTVADNEPIDTGDNKVDEVQSETEALHNIEVDELHAEDLSISNDNIDNAVKPAIEPEQNLEPQSIDDSVDAVVSEGKPDEHKVYKSESESESLDIPEDEEEFVSAPVIEKSSSSFGLGFVVGLLLGLVLGAAALFFYAMYYVNTPILIE